MSRNLQALGEALLLGVFSIGLCTLTVLGALGVDPTTTTSTPTPELTSAHRQAR